MMMMTMQAYPVALGRT